MKNKVTGENIKRKMIGNVIANYMSKLMSRKQVQQPMNSNYVTKVGPAIIQSVSNTMYAKYTGKRKWFGIGPKILKPSNVSLAATMKHANLLKSLQPKSLNVTDLSSA